GIEDEAGPRRIAWDRVEEEVVGDSPVGDVDDAGVQPAVDRDVVLLFAGEGPGRRRRDRDRGDREETELHWVIVPALPPFRSSRASPASPGTTRTAGQTGPRAAASR